MFLRVVRAAGGKGVKHEYVRVVEAFRENGKTRHRTILNLGRRDLLAAHLDLDKLIAAVARRCRLRSRPSARGRACARRLGLGTDAGGTPAVARARAGDDARSAGARRTARHYDGERSRRWCWSPIGSLRRAASTGWHAGWRPTSCATATVGAGFPPGATRARAS